MNIKQWVALAEMNAAEPLPSDLRAALAKAAGKVHQLALAHGPAPDRAAAAMVNAVGLTAGEVEKFREEQKALFATMAVEFNCHAPGQREKMDFIEGRVAYDLKVHPRTVRRWRNRVLNKKGI